MKKPIVWNKENVITNGIWIIIGKLNDYYRFKSDNSVKAPKSIDHTRSFVEYEERHIKSWEDTTLNEIEDKSVYDETFNLIVFHNHGAFNLEHIEDCFYVAGIGTKESVKIGVNDNETMLIVKYEKLTIAIMGMIV